LKIIMPFTFPSLRAALLLPSVVAAVAVAVIPAGCSSETETRKIVAAKNAKESQIDEDKIREGVAEFFGMHEINAELITPVLQGELYEIVLNNGEIIYTDKTMSFFFFGNIIDAKTKIDLTSQRIDKLASIDFNSLPLEQAIKRVNGNGQRVIATFEDPNCSFCKYLWQELQKVKDVTIYTYLYPVLSEDSITKSRNIWCAEDKAAAWASWINNDKEPKARSCDSTAIDRNIELASKLRIAGTPILFFTDGTRIGGYREASELEGKLAEVSAEPGK